MKGLISDASTYLLGEGGVFFFGWNFGKKDFSRRRNDATPLFFIYIHSLRSGQEWERRKRVNFIRPQIYFTKKDEIEKLEEDFMKDDEKSVSEYLRKLVMLGYQSKRKEDSASINAELRRLQRQMESLKQDLSLVKQCVFEMYKFLEKKEVE